MIGLLTVGLVNVDKSTFCQKVNLWQWVRIIFKKQASITLHILNLKHLDVKIILTKIKTQNPNLKAKSCRLIANNSFLLFCAPFPSGAQSHRSTRSRLRPALRTPSENWPPNKEQLQPVEEELRPSFLQLHTDATSLIDLSRLSSWLKLLRTQAFITRFVYNIKSRLKKIQPTTGAITAGEYDSAEAELIKRSQIESYKLDIVHPESNERTVPKKRFV